LILTFKNSSIGKAVLRYNEIGRIGRLEMKKIKKKSCLLKEVFYEY